MDKMNCFSNTKSELFRTDYEKGKHRHYVTVSSERVDELVLMLDPGADTTVVSKRSLATATGLSEEEVDSKLLVSTTKDIRLANGETISSKLYPCCILDAAIGDLKLKKFFFMVVGLGSSDLIGSDFLDFCKISKDIDDSYKVLDFDYKGYEKDFCSRNDFSVNPHLAEYSCMNYFGGAEDEIL